MTMKLHPARYARALADVTSERETLNLVGQALSRVVQVLEGSPPLSKVLAHPEVPLKVKRGILREAFTGAVPEEVMRLLVLLAESCTLSPKTLREIGREYRRIVDQRLKIVRVLVHSAFPMSPEERQALTEALSRVSGKTVDLEVKEEPELIGGVMVNIGGKVYDGSAAGFLQGMAARLKRAELPAAREGASE